MSRTIGLTLIGLLIAVLGWTPAMAGNWGPSQSGRVSVTVYEHADFKGRQATFFGDTAWLPRGISSIRINGRCTVTLFNNYNFQGARQNITSNVRNLRGAIVGNDQVLSLTISPFQADDPGANRPGSRRGEVILYEHAHFKGSYTRVTGDIPDLGATRVGNDAVSSIKIKDAEITVYEHANFRGRSQTFNGSVERLTGTRVGNDAISSIRVRWFDGSGQGGGSGSGQGGGNDPSQGGGSGSGQGGGLGGQIKGKPFKQNQ